MCVPRVKAKSKNCCTLPWFLLILHDDLIAQHPLLLLLIASYWLWQGKKEQVRDWKQRQRQDRDNDVGMWSGPVRGNRAKDSNLHWHQAPNLATLQTNLVKISPCLMPSRERKWRCRKKVEESEGQGRKRAKERRATSIWDGVSRRGGRGIKGTLKFKRAPESLLLSQQREANHRTHQREGKSETWYHIWNWKMSVCVGGDKWS